jgi:hypothetical protein
VSDPFAELDEGIDTTLTPSAPDRSMEIPDRGSILTPPLLNIYTALLGVSFVAILISCVLLIVELQSYGFRLKP